MTTHLFSVNDAAKLLSIAEHKINYATKIGELPDSTHRVGGIRVYTVEDIRRMAQYFGVPVPSEIGGHHD